MTTSASYHVKVHNMGRGARVVHDGARPVRFPPGEWTDAILSEETIKLIQNEKHDRDTDEEPRLELQKGEKADEAPQQPHQFANPMTVNQPQSGDRDEDTRLGAEHEQRSQHVASAAGEDNGNHAASHKRRGPPHG